jgi:hypothetical protein
METVNKKRAPMSDQTNKRLSWVLGIVSFIFCFVGIMAEQDQLVFGTLMIITGMAIGLTIGKAIKKFTGWGGSA